MHIPVQPVMAFEKKLVPIPNLSSVKIYLKSYIIRHVILPADLARHVPKTHLMSETEWRNLGVQQSPGWVHYMMHVPEPHVLLFRRPRTDILTNTRSTAFQREYQNVYCV
ncbi:cyclin-dependent kinases regulatory subunit-like isoform X1 [Apis laboriosa]|uniref:cyclin-dependent kinases regulatory subunit-like isoform X1 n=1 Tax=Apis laboriosa TaxID=183418 RepID=UPI001CC480DC|nr:cyclin-dependent kinases regulatory subunit-like isoform X1 [Apis laboriosa]